MTINTHHQYGPLTLFYRNAQQITRSGYQLLDNNILKNPVLTSLPQVIANNASSTIEQYTKIFNTYQTNQTAKHSYRNTSLHDDNLFLETEALQESSWSAIIDNTPSTDLLQQIQRQRNELSIKLGQFIYSSISETASLTIEILSSKLQSLASRIYSFQIESIASLIVNQLPLSCLSQEGKYFIGGFVLGEFEKLWISDLSFNLQITHKILCQCMETSELYTILLHPEAPNAIAVHYITETADNAITYSCSQKAFKDVCNKQQDLYERLQNDPSTTPKTTGDFLSTYNYLESVTDLNQPNDTSKRTISPSLEEKYTGLSDEHFYGV